jgi:hypothetical protein
MRQPRKKKAKKLNYVAANDFKVLYKDTIYDVLCCVQDMRFPKRIELVIHLEDKDL